MASLEELITAKLIDLDVKITFAESITGGLLCGRMINAAGVSRVLKGSFVTYSDEFKQKFLGVDEVTFQKFGAVSAKCAIEMAEGARRAAGADIAVSVTGEAGPDPSEEKPVGLCFVGYADKHRSYAREYMLEGDRNTIRERVIEEALQLLLIELQ